MANYFIDCEFIEGFHKPFLGKERHFIDLISIAIVREDGEKYYAISSEYNYNDADEWVKANVIIPLYLSTVHGDARNSMDATNFHKHFGRTNKQIQKDIRGFVYDEAFHDYDGMTGIDYWLDQMINTGQFKPEFYGYYADYDWVLFCSLFGRMIDLPKGFPMYCIDLKQTLDEVSKGVGFDVKTLEDYPKQTGEHLALNDAEWAKKLYDFLQKHNVAP